MYYYIFDIKKCKKRSQVENIKNYLSDLGISGEYTYPSGAQTVKELVDLGLSKQYTTIVAIGGDEIANAVASRLVGKKEAMGIIPLEASEELSSLIGTNNWQKACDSLRFRKITDIQIGSTAAGNCFLTNIKLDMRNPVEITLELKDFMIQARVKSFVVSNYSPTIKKIGPEYLDILMTSVSQEEKSLFNRLSIFGHKEISNDSLSFTLLHARSMRVFTKNQIPLVGHEGTVAKTPQFIESTDDFLRLITTKKSEILP